MRVCACARGGQAATRTSDFQANSKTRTHLPDSLPPEQLPNVAMRLVVSPSSAGWLNCGRLSQPPKLFAVRDCPPPFALEV